VANCPSSSLGRIRCKTHGTGCVLDWRTTVVSSVSKTTVQSHKSSRKRVGSLLFQAPPGTHVDMLYSWISRAYPLDILRLLEGYKHSEYIQLVAVGLSSRREKRNLKTRCKGHFLPCLEDWWKRPNRVTGEKYKDWNYIGQRSAVEPNSYPLAHLHFLLPYW